MVRDGYKKLLATEPTAAGDLSMVFSYMKMLDPNSVVREQEFANAQNAAGVPDRIRNQYNKLKSGQFLGEEQRKEFKEQAAKIYAEQYETQVNQKTAYGEIASRAGMDPRDVLDQVYAPSLPELKAQWADSRMQALGVDLSSVDATAQKYGMTIEQVIETLEANGG